MSTPDILGTTVGNYRVERLLGRGGTSDVYLLAHRSLTDTYLAMKVLRQVRLAPGSFCRPRESEAHTASDPMPSLLVERFEQEARVAAAIGSPRVVAPLDIGQLPDGTPYILMEYVRGVSLSEELNAGPLGVRRALSIGRQVAETLALAHAKGIVHRDLKPANIMLDDNDRVRLLDFGAARVSGALRVVETTHQAVLGTPGYIAPEVLEGREADARADVYALGVTLFQMLTGELPFPNQTSFATARAMVAGPAPRVSALRPRQLAAVASSTDEIVARALACDPAARPTIDELSRELGGDSSELSAVSVARRSPRRWSRGVIGALALGALVAAGGWAVQSARAESFGHQRMRHAVQPGRLIVITEHAARASAAGEPPVPLVGSAVPSAEPSTAPAQVGPSRTRVVRTRGAARARPVRADADREDSPQNVELRAPIDALQWMED